MDGNTDATTAGDTPAVGRVRKRAPEACTFCRRRKIKCSTERPTCANCKTHGMTCNYEPIDDAVRARTARPSKVARREITTEHAATAPEPRAKSVSDDLHTRSNVDSASRANSVSRIVVSSNGVPSYHGRTSTLFEENYQDRSTPEANTRMPEEWVEKGLIAEAACQRQLEDVNLRLGKLDFDGVEPELGQHLLSLHWNRQHHSFLITYRPAFMRDMACKGPNFSKLLLNAIFFSASKFSPRRELRRDADDVRTAGWKFRERVRGLLGGALDKSDITTIQALLIMCNSLFALGDERSAAWLYAGLAFRMIVDLGIHVDKAGLTTHRKFSDEDLEIRRRVFWAAFVVDKIQSLYQGRPVTLKEADTLVPIKFLDTYEELEHWTPQAYLTQSDVTYSGSPAYSISTFKHLCKLSLVLSDILSTIYTERSSDKSSAELSTKLESIHATLQAWYRDLPAHLADLGQLPTTPPPNVLSLLAMYHVLVILLHHPFVADGHLYSTSRSISVNSLKCCATAANDIVHLLRVFDKAFSVRRAPYLISYATYVAATIHVRIAAKRGPGSDAHSSLAACLAVFRENQETNPAVRRANALVQNLMKRLGVQMHSIDDCQIHKDRSSGSQRQSPEAVSSAATGRGPSLQGLDLDGIIQSFVREQENAQITQVGTPEHSTMNTPTLMAPPRPTAVAGSMLDAAGPDVNSLNYDYNGQWLAHGQHQMYGDVSVPVDDLYYGFNSAALDSIPITPFLEWNTM
ncbi:fungal-specific transcription factor domain-containing protein [Boeremia exigua]|uniref:fungal-specific transcription factor domain-containing protein n=1 Tax=Boeremia exigua TaxID=749465 RepID=UPI001E8D469D|nr:fungal-specific transcription factor domain-containing protein [Boeremia exigua]KAH6642248.1 fungal-specific transcription factor domain-containing protein [Boeremia exigua]